MLGQLNGLDLDITNYIVEDIDQARSTVAGEVYLDGLTNVLAEPEFSGSEDARRALRLLEERSLLQDLLARTVLSWKRQAVRLAAVQFMGLATRPTACRF